ncbi:MAG: hypothetical protein PHU33_08525 [Bacteroidales bacterium]|jgi:hypothetical protein|nr:hypothetical protein [Bacteroidales bacterium]MDD2963979.1 hypothetical protein [Bacteroidales bacterium]
MIKNFDKLLWHILHDREAISSVAVGLVGFIAGILLVVRLVQQVLS